MSDQPNPQPTPASPPLQRPVPSHRRRLMPQQESQTPGFPSSSLGGTTPPQPTVSPFQAHPEYPAPLSADRPMAPPAFQAPPPPTAPPQASASAPVSLPAAQTASTSEPVAPTPRRAVAPPGQPPALQSLVQQLLNGQRSPDQKFYLVVVPDDGPPRVEEFEECAPLVSRMIELLGQDMHLFPFLGTRLGISKGPNRFLSTPFGTLPLFTLPDVNDLELEEDGFVGAARETLEAPQAAEPPRADVEPGPPGEHGVGEIGSPSGEGLRPAGFPQDEDESVVVPTEG